MASKQGSILITGCNGGLGTAIVRRVTTEHQYSSYHAIFTARNLETATALDKATSSAQQNHSFENQALDLSSLDNVRRFADSINLRVKAGSLPPIRALILNAGYQEHATQSFSTDGFDMSFQANYLSHWLLILRLLESMDKESGRIVVIGSSTHENDSMGFFAGDEWKTIYTKSDALAYGTWSSSKEYPDSSGGMRRYGAAKLCVIMSMYALQDRLDKDPQLSNISVMGVDPGGMPSNLTRRGGTLLAAARLVLPVMAKVSTALSPNGPMRTTAKSAADVLNCAFDTEKLGKFPKKMYLNGDTVATTSSESRAQENQEDLWKASVRYANVSAAETLLYSLN